MDLQEWVDHMLSVCPLRGIPGLSAVWADDAASQTVLCMAVVPVRGLGDEGHHTVGATTGEMITFLMEPRCRFQ